MDICEHGADVPALGSITDLSESCLPVSGCLSCFGWKQRLYADPRHLRERHRALDAIAQFPHMPGQG